jgi:hypothetical protein
LFNLRNGLKALLFLYLCSFLLFLL